MTPENIKDALKLSNMDTSNEYWPLREEDEYKQRFVAILDILGFSVTVKENPTPDEICHYFENLKYRLSDNANKIAYIIISDSLIIYSTDDSKESFDHLSKAVESILSLSAMDQIDYVKGKDVPGDPSKTMPFRYRGAVSFGDFYINKDRNIFFGKALLDAIEWEKKQNWIGAIITPQCLDFIRSEGYSDGNCLVEYMVPLKQDRYVETLCFNWITDVTQEFDIEKVKDGVRRMYEHTNIFIKHCRNLRGQNK